MLYIRHEGRELALSWGELYLDHGYAPTDRQIRESLAGYLEVDLRELSDCVIERSAEGDATVRPMAMVA